MRRFGFVLAVGFAAAATAGSATAQEHSALPASATAVQAHVQSKALDRLQDARVTLARITEHSTSLDARDRLGSLAAAIDRLVEAYTGETRREAQRAAETGVSSPAAVVTPEAALQWRDAYRVARSALARIIGARAPDEVATAASGATPPHGTAGGAAAGAGEIRGIPRPAQEDLQRLRSQLDQFYRLADRDAQARSATSR